METILPAFIVLILLLFAVLTPAQSYLAAQDQIAASSQLMDQRLIDQSRTNLTPVSHYISDDGSVVHLTVRNSGQTKLADFDLWDMILQYYDSAGVYHIVRLPTADSSTQGLNSWSVVSISQDLFDPGIFNPGESITIRLEFSPAVGPETANRLALNTPSGIGVTTVFIGPPFPPTPVPPAPTP